MNPGKGDHFTKKVNGEKIHVQKRYLLWPLRDVLEMLNGSELASGEGFKDRFVKKLSFSLFYKFIKARKQYIFNNKIPQYTCLCEVCENTVLVGQRLEPSVQTKYTIRPTFHRRRIFMLIGFKELYDEQLQTSWTHI